MVEDEEELPVVEDEEELPPPVGDEEELPPVEDEEELPPVEDEEELPPVGDEEELPPAEDEEELPIVEDEEELPVDCDTSEWSAWSECSKSCRDSDGEVVTRRRTRTVVREPAFGGASCGALEEVEVCDVPRCPINCAVGPWRDEGECEPACRATITSVSSMKQVRDVTREAKFGGEACPSLEQTRVCALDEVPRCPVDCVEEWGEWTECSPACRPDEATRSTQSSSRAAIVTFPAFGGKSCSPVGIRERECEVPRCPIDCKHSEWSDWGPCTTEEGKAVTCREMEAGTITRRRTRTVEVPAAFGGEACSGPLEEVEACELEMCAPVDCQVSEFGEWSQCPEEGGTPRPPGFQRTRTRTILTEPRYGGAECPPLEEVASCPVDCDGNWSGWSQCSKSCGPGVQTRTFTVTQQPAHGGKACPALTQTRSCNIGACPTCTTGPWSQWLNIDNTSCCFYTEDEWGGLESIKPYKGLFRSRTVNDPLAASGLCTPPSPAELQQYKPCPEAFSIEEWEVFGGEHCISGPVSV